MAIAIPVNFQMCRPVLLLVWSSKLCTHAGKPHHALWSWRQRPTYDKGSRKLLGLLCLASEGPPILSPAHAVHLSVLPCILLRVDPVLLKSHVHSFSCTWVLSSSLNPSTSPDVPDVIFWASRHVSGHPGGACAGLYNTPPPGGIFPAHKQPSKCSI